ncbi:transposase family protein, partial [Streptomyces fungicidicus]|uniref:transposase family protein n=1 Tax=Streptomyces fungicidicus TaxID=68203 RepID=UPI00384BBF8E
MRPFSECTLSWAAREPASARLSSTGSPTGRAGNVLLSGLSADVIAELVAELGPLWHERHQVRIASRSRKRAIGTGAKHRLVFVDRLLATLVHLRHGVTHDVLACWSGWTAPPPPAPLVRCDPCWPSAAAPSVPECGRGTWPRSSITSAQAGRPGSSTAPRFQSAGRQTRDPRRGRPRQLRHEAIADTTFTSGLAPTSFPHLVSAYGLFSPVAYGRTSPTLAAGGGSTAVDLG